MARWTIILHGDGKMDEDTAQAVIKAAGSATEGSYTDPDGRTKPLIQKASGPEVTVPEKPDITTQKPAKFAHR